MISSWLRYINSIERGRMVYTLDSINGYVRLYDTETGQTAILSEEMFKSNDLDDQHNENFLDWKYLATVYLSHGLWDRYV